MDKDYEGATTEWIMCATSTLRQITFLSEKESVDLGKLFMEYVIDEKTSQE